MCGGFARAFWSSFCAVGIAFVVGYPLHISALRLHSARDYVYSAVFWSVLLTVLIVTRSRWLQTRKHWWLAALSGVAMGYGSSLIGYASLVVAVGRVQNLKEAADVLFVLSFPLIAFGWMLGGIAAICAYALDRLFSGQRFVLEGTRGGVANSPR